MTARGPVLLFRLVCAALLPWAVTATLVLAGCQPAEAPLSDGDSVGTVTTQPQGSTLDLDLQSVADTDIELGLSVSVVEGSSIVAATEVWQLAVGVPVASQGGSPAAFRGDTVAVVFVDGTVMALSHTDGRLLWEASAADLVLGVWATFEGFLLAMPEALTMFDAATGEETWSLGLPVATVAISPGVIYVSGRQGSLTAVESQLGTILWRTDLTGDPAVTAHSMGHPIGPPLVVSTVVFVGYEGGLLAAINADDGTIIWRSSLPRSLVSGIAADASRLFVAGNDGMLILVDRDDGVELRAVATGMVVLAAPMVVRDSLVVAGANGVIAETDVATTGNSVGEGDEPADVALGREIRALSSHLAGAPMIVGDTLIAGEFSGYLNGIDVKSGNLLWRVDAAGRPAGYPVLSRDSLIVVTANGTVTSFGVELLQ